MYRILLKSQTDNVCCILRFEDLRKILRQVKSLCEFILSVFCGMLPEPAPSCIHEHVTLNPIAMHARAAVWVLPLGYNSIKQQEKEDHICFG